LGWGDSKKEKVSSLLKGGGAKMEANGEKKMGHLKKGGISTAKLYSKKNGKKKGNNQPRGGETATSPGGCPRPKERGSKTQKKEWGVG